MEKRPYTWDEIAGFLIKELKKTKHILTYGTIGSLNVTHDIDTIITKKPDSSSSDFYREVHQLFKSVNDYLYSSYKAKAIRFPSHKEEFLPLFGYTDKDLAFHTMIYTSYPQIERDWNWALFQGEKIKDILLKEYICLIGNVNDLFSKSFQKPLYADPVFVHINHYDRMNSNYSDKELVRIMSSYLDFLYRKKLRLPTPPIKNRKDVEEAFYALCEKLDSFTGNS